MAKELTATDYTYSTRIGIVMGFLAGWAIGIAMLVYLDSPQINQTPGVETIPLWWGFGFGLYGLIVGGGGIFAHLGRKQETTEAPANVMAHRAA